MDPIFRKGEPFSEVLVVDKDTLVDRFRCVSFWLLALGMDTYWVRSVLNPWWGWYAVTMTED